MDVGSLKYDLDVDDKKLHASLDKSDKAVKSFGDKMSDHWDSAVKGSQMFAAGLAIAGAAAVGFGVKAVQAFAESENVMAQTQAVIKSTGGAAGISAEEITKLASSLQKVTVFSDEAIQSGENLLLTFTAIGKDIFPQATEIMLDMSQALGQDVKSSAIQLGKALQDPILGVTALRRVGVNFNEAQQDVIKNLVETGRSAEAQKLIMAELTKEFGGSARAAAETFSGRLMVMKNAFDDLLEGVGSVIVKALNPLIQKFSEWVQNMGGAEGVAEKLRAKFAELKPLLPVIVGAIIGGLIPAFVALGISIWSAMAPLLPFIAIGALLGLLIRTLLEHFGGLHGIMERLQPVFTVLSQIWNDIMLPALRQLWDVISNQLLPALKQLWERVEPVLLPALKALAVLIGVIIVTQIMIAIAVITLIATALTWLANIATWVIDRIKSYIGLMVGAFNWWKDTTVNAFQTVMNWVGNVKDTIGSIVGHIERVFSGIWQALTEPFRKAFDWIKDAAGKMGSAVGDAVKKSLGIHSPSKVFMNIGENMGLGMIAGYSSVLEDLNNRPLAGAMTNTVNNSNSNSNTTNFNAPFYINSPQNADYLLGKIDRDTQLESMGVSPI